VLDSKALSSRLKVSWQPYELNPSMPFNGMDRRTYRSRKFGSWERSTALDAQIAAAGSRAGIAFRFDRMTRTPNSFQAHRLIWLAGRTDVQPAVVEALFRAYFTEGRDVGELGVLIDIGTNAGIERERVVNFLDSKDGVDKVRDAEQGALRAGIVAVPTFLLDDKPLFSGAVPPDVMTARLNAGLGHAD
jgi:predicted DsbA family dithiol-disulfide isomerase